MFEDYVWGLFFSSVVRTYGEKNIAIPSMYGVFTYILRTFNIPYMDGIG